MVCVLTGHGLKDPDAVAGGGGIPHADPRRARRDPRRDGAVARASDLAQAIGPQASTMAVDEVLGRAVLADVARPLVDRAAWPSVSAQPVRMMRRSGQARPIPLISATPASMSGRRGSTRTTSGRVSLDELERGADVAGTPVDLDLAGHAEEVREALLHAPIAVHDDHLGVGCTAEQHGFSVRFDSRSANEADGAAPPTSFGRSVGVPARIASIWVPRAGLALDPQLAADEVHPLAHADEARWPRGTAVGSKPAPSSVTDRRTRSAVDARRLIVAFDALACLTTLWSASWPMRYRASSAVSVEAVDGLGVDHDDQARPALHRGGVGAQRLDQAIGLERRRAGARR